MEIGQRLKNKRIEKSMTLIELSKLTGIPNGTLSKYENNKNNPSLENFYSLSKILEVSPNWLLTGKEDIYNLNNEEINLLKKYNILTDKNKGKVENFIDERISEQEKKQSNNQEELA